MRSFAVTVTCLALLGLTQANAQTGKTLPQAAPAKSSAPEATRLDPSVGGGTPTRMRSLLSWADGLMRDGERQDLPYIHTTRPLSGGTSGFTAHVTEAQYQELTTEELALLPGLGQVGATVEVRSSLGYHRKVPTALVDIYPYRRNPATGRIERLVAHSLQLVEEHNGPNGHRKSGTYPDHSKLASGSWYRFTVLEEGVYELDHAFLQQLGVNTEGLASDRINIYGNHEGLLPFKNLPFRPTDLELNAVQVDDGGDGQFDEGDRILFYASSAQRWALNAAGTRFVHTKNVYTDSASYFVGIDVGDPPKRITEVAQSTDAPTDQVVAFNDRQVIDRDNINILKSGRTFFAETYDLVTSYSYNFSVPFLHAGDSLYLTTEVMARTVDSMTSSFRVQAGSANTVFPVPGVNGSNEAAYGNIKNVTTALAASGSSLPITVTFIKHDPITSLGYMNFLELNARRDLRMSGDQLRFRDLGSFGTGRVAEFTLDQASGVAGIWEVTDPLNVGRVAYTDNGGQKVFRLGTETLREFIAFRGSGFLRPKAIGAVPNQDLHATEVPTDLVIVCPPQFMGEAQRLAERRASEGLSVVMVTPQQVYNEFSSGQRDATAIKRYMKMLYDRAGNDPALMPRYLLLFGDGSYENISLSPNNQNLIPTYQTVDALRPAYCYTADDYFGLLDDSEGEAPNDLVDIGIGRLPVSDATQAKQAVDKLLNYDRLGLAASSASSSCLSGSDGGANDWRDLVLFCADDQDGGADGTEPTHTLNSEFLANKVENEHPCLNLNKIYLDSYVQYSTPGGERYPEAEQDLRDRVQKGCLLVNYVGHGGEVGWSHERFLNNSTILGWTNYDRLPLFMTATCEFSRWDDPARTSAGEYVFLNPSGGGIGLMTTTRIAYSGQNQVLSIDFYDHALDATDEQGRAQRLGDIYRRTKTAATPADPNAQPNHRNFTLLGDPSLRLAMARNEARITFISDTLGNAKDTLRALDVVRVEGEVLDASGVLDADFNGTVVPTVYDKKETLVTLANDAPSQPLNFSLRKGIIYRGRATVTGGRFSFTFVVPKDINYQVGPGRIGVYAESLDANACGYTNDPKVGDTNPDAAEDNAGPRIELYMNDERFVNGGTTNETPLLFAKLSDENGINTLGNSIGHDLVAVLDGDAENGLVLNDVYQADKDTYKSGQVRYRMSTLSEGRHTLDLKAWDVHNNSSQKSTEFVVAPSAELALEHVLNYPNPFTTRTEFYFEHNRPCSTLDCQVQVFTIAGRLVKTLNRRLDCDGFRSEPLAWDGLDDFGDKLGRGVYVYRLSITTTSGEEADKVEKLVILR